MEPWRADAIEVGLTGLVPSVRARFVKRSGDRVQNFVSTLLDVGGITAEELDAAAREDTQLSRLIESTVRRVYQDTEKGHAEAMARVAANAWQGDEAAIDEAAMVVDAIAALRPPLVRALVEIRKTENAMTGDAAAITEAQLG